MLKKSSSYIGLINIVGILLPLFVYFTFNFHNPTVSDFWQFMADFSPFTFVSDVLDNVTTLLWGYTFDFNIYLSYITGVELFSIFIDFVLWLPRWFRDFFIRGYRNGKN